MSQSTDGISECDISADGSWQRRGYASLNGFVSGVERVTDKVVDVEVMTKDCRVGIINKVILFTTIGSWHMIALLTMKVHRHLWNLKRLLEFLIVQLKNMV